MLGYPAGLCGVGKLKDAPIHHGLTAHAQLALTSPPTNTHL